MIDTADIEREANRYLLESGANLVAAEAALRPDLAGMPIFDGVLVGAAAAADALFAEFRREGVVGPQMLAPTDWLPGAKSVVSFFFFNSDAVVKGNAAVPDAAADEWLHARVEGQQAMIAVAKHLVGLLQDEGCDVIVPVADPRFSVPRPFASAWSERHVAHACGLGTFGMSRGLITRHGMAGRFISLVTTAELTPTPREYAGPFDWCIVCGACARKCPVGAIDISRGFAEAKDHLICAPFVGATHTTDARGVDRYGCGKCQTGVPCATRRPPARKSRGA